jgi:hypothetical protein
VDRSFPADGRPHVRLERNLRSPASVVERLLFTALAFR